MKQLNCGKFYLFLLVILCLILEEAKGQTLFQLKRYYPGYDWKLSRRSFPGVEVIPRSNAGYVERSNVGNGDIQMLRDNGNMRDPCLGLIDTYYPFPEELTKVKLFMSNDINSDEPPPHEQVAKMARYLVATTLWTSLSTISSRGDTVGSPFSTILSFADGTKVNSTGNPYMYMTALDLAAIDLAVNPNASMVLSLAQGKYCEQHNYDPEDPRCAMVSLAGKMVKLSVGSDEEKFAKLAIFDKHPIMKSWPSSHNWYVVKLELTSIIVRDFFGGAKQVALKDYFAANPLQTK